MSRSSLRNWNPRALFMACRPQCAARCLSKKPVYFISGDDTLSAAVVGTPQGATEEAGGNAGPSMSCLEHCKGSHVGYMASSEGCEISDDLPVSLVRRAFASLVYPERRCADGFRFDGFGLSGGWLWGSECNLTSSRMTTFNVYWCGGWSGSTVTARCLSSPLSSTSARTSLDATPRDRAT